VAARKVTSIPLNGQSGQVNVTSKMTIPGYVAQLPQVEGCSQAVQSQTIDVVVPLSYASAYGSLAFTAAGSQSTDSHLGISIKDASLLTADSIYAPSEVSTTPVTMRGMALRCWSGLTNSTNSAGCSPPNGSGTLEIDEIWLYTRPYQGFSSPIRNNLAGFPLAPSAPSTLVAKDVSVPIYYPAWEARHWDTWPIIIPFNRAAFTFDPALGFTLGVWMRLKSTTSCDYVVDAAFDETLAYSYAHTGSTVANATDGLAPIIGFLEGPVVTIPPSLDVYGFPRVGDTLLFQVRSAGANRPAVIDLGFADPGTMVGACRRYSSADFATISSLTTTAMGDVTRPFIVPNNPNLLHQHVFAQAAITGGSSTLYSNGLRLTIGGVAP
jgi:hypothetical protein